MVKINMRCFHLSNRIKASFVRTNFVRFFAAILMLASSSLAFCAELKVCAVPQLYNALNAIKKESSVAFKPFFATSSDLYAQISNSSANAGVCDIVLSSDEKLPIRLIRSQKADGSSLKPFARVPLVMWSQDPKLFNSTNGTSLLSAGKIKSLAVAKADLSPVGYATKKVLASRQISTSALKDHIYRAEQEYQVYSMVTSGNVQAGIVTKPLVESGSSVKNGSYWEIPRSLYPDIQYYVVVMQSASSNPNASKIVNELLNSDKLKLTLQKYGFYDLKSF